MTQEQPKTIAQDIKELMEVWDKLQSITNKYEESRDIMFKMLKLRPWYLDYPVEKDKI